MSHATIRATIIPEIVKLICKNMNVDENTALDMFYNSATGANLADDDTGLYGQSVLFIYGLFKEEVNEAEIDGKEAAVRMIKKGEHGWRNI